jgi:threonine aldolase
MPDTPRHWKVQFASDHVAGICPQAWAALAAANSAPGASGTRPDEAPPAFVPSYGDDEEFTRLAVQHIRTVFEKPDAAVFFVLSGTVANALSLAALCQPYHGILRHPLAHVEHDEANAPEFFTGGAKLLDAGGDNGKIDPTGLPAVFARGHGVHSAKPRAVTLTQATEVGTVYTPDEVRRIAALKQARPEYGLKVHMDGARFANALAALDGVSPADLTWRAGVDVLSLGGSKNGGPPSEAVVFFDPSLADEFGWRLKQSGQIVSKMRYLSAPWLGLLRDGVWLTNARHANACARRLGRGLEELGLLLRFPVQTNAVFVYMSDGLARGLERRGWHFYPFTAVDAWRFMCNWATTQQAIDDLLADVRAAQNEEARRG